MHPSNGWLHSWFFFCTVIPLSAASIRTGSLPCGVVDKSNGLPVAAATVCIRELDRCHTADSAGRLVVDSCPPGVYEVYASAARYDTIVLPNVVVNAGRNTLLRIELPKTCLLQELDRISVSAKRIEAKKAEQTASVTRLGTFELGNTAGTANDVNRVLQTLPSVVSGGDDMDNALFVRGGHSRENVFIIDGIELDNISHFSDIGSSGGGLGFIDGALLQSLDFYAGSIPASYPPRMSAVADMTMRDGSTTERNYKAHLNIAGFGLTAEGPFPKNTGSYLLSVRYLDLRSLRSLLDLEGVPRFGDSQSRFNLRLNQSNSLSLTTLVAYDQYLEFAQRREGMNYSYDWDNRIFQYGTGLQWNSVHDRFHNRLMVTVSERNEDIRQRVSGYTGPFNVYDEWYLNGELTTDTVLQSGGYLSHRVSRIIDKTLMGWKDNRRVVQIKNDFTLYLRENDQAAVGICAAQHRLQLADQDGRRNYSIWYWLADTADPGSIESGEWHYQPYTIDSTIYDTVVGGYGNYVLRQGRFKAVAGVRADYFRMLRDYGISPRCAISFEFPLAGTVALSGGLYYQQPAELSRQIRNLAVPDPNYPRPRPGVDEIELQRSWQGVLSYEKQIATSHMLAAEAYVKWYDREYALENPGTYQFEREFADALEEDRLWHLPAPDGRKKAYGIELSFQKKRQRGFHYAVGYTCLSVMNRYADGAWYNDRNNVRNSGSLTLGYEFLKRHCVTTRMQFREGRPYCKAVIDEYGGMVYDTLSGYFTERLKPIASINLRYTFRFFPRFGTIAGYIELWNLLNCKPVIERDLEWNGYRDFTGNGIIPLLGIEVDF